MPSVREWLAEVLGEVDAALLGRVHLAVSVDTERVRRWLRAADKPFVDPAGCELPEAGRLRETGAWVVEQSRLKLAVVGGLAGFGGAASVPPEALASTIASLRLAQRLAIVYGFDPASDRGEMAVWRALAAGFEVDLPEDGPVGMRVSQVPAVVARGSQSRYPAGALATAVMRQTAWSIGRRLSRWLALPLVSAGVSAAGAHRRISAAGERMHATLERLADAPPVDPARLQDALEVG